MEGRSRLCFGGDALVEGEDQSQQRVPEKEREEKKAVWEKWIEIV